MGELPLMRNLNAIKQAKNSPASRALPRKSPGLESISSITHEMSMPQFDGLEGQHYDRTDAADELDVHVEVSTKKDRSRSSYRRHAIGIGTPETKGFRKSPQVKALEARMMSPNSRAVHPRMSWDLGKEVTSNMDAYIEHDGFEHVQGYSGDGTTDKRTTDWVSYSMGVSPEIRKWGDFQDANAMPNHSGFFGHQDDEDGRVRTLHKTSKLEQGHKLWGHNDQTLSPLILNPNTDMQRSPHTQSLFSLEEPLDAEEEVDSNVIEDWQHVLSYQREASQAKVGARSPSPFTPHGAWQAHKKEATGAMDMSRSPHVPTNTTARQLFPENCRPAPSESEFFEYEVKALEIPTKKESGKAHQKSKHPSQVQARSMKEERMGLLQESITGTRRKSVSVGDPSTMGRKSVSSSFPSKSPKMEPLPLLTELEDFNGSEQIGGTSVDGDNGGLSMSELHGELELVASHNTSDNNNEGRLVKVPDGQGLQLAVPACKELALCDFKPRSLSQKYRPKAFEEVVGQNIVAQALSNAVLKGKIAPVYLFQGSRGTGKTSAARIFAAGLTCTLPDGHRPCGICRSCMSVATGKWSEVREVDAASNNGVERVKALLEETISGPPLSRYKVFIIDECHVLTTETWNALLRILEEPPMNVVFILITTDADQLPRTVVSRCQKFPFPKIKDTEIVKRLQKLAELESLAIDAETLNLIASRSDGSLRDAETILDQVSLLGHQINSSTVYELVGSVSDERMLGLLDSALEADTISTVRRARELVDSGVEPLSLMSRLATLITDILAGSFKLTNIQRKGFFRKQSLSEQKLERLRMAMKTLADAEKQLRTSNDRTTWLIAALLQLGPDRSYMFSASCVGTSVTQSPIALEEVGENETMDFEHRSLAGRQTWTDGNGSLSQNITSELVPQGSGIAGHSYAVQDSSAEQVEASLDPLQRVRVERLDEPMNSLSDKRLSSSKLNDVWCKVVERCQSNTLRQLLHASVKLVSISISEVDAVVHLEVGNPQDNSSCSRSQKRITSLFEMVLGFPVEIKMSLAEAAEPAKAFTNDRRGDAAPRHTRQSVGSQGHHEWENQAPPSLHPNAMEGFQPIPHGAATSTQKMKVPPGNSNLAGSVSEESQEIRRFLSSMASGLGEMEVDVGQAGHHEGLGDYFGEMNDAFARGERGIAEIQMLSPEFSEVEDLHDKVSRPRHSAYEGPVSTQSYDVDGRRSYDTGKGRKGSHLSMVRRLSMRSRIQSLPSSDPNSPERGHAHDRVGRNPTLKNSGKDRERTEGNGELVIGDQEEAAAGTHKKGKLKGGFARFFQGKLISKQSGDGE